MSDPTPAPATVAAFNPADLAALGPQSRAAFAATMEKAGFEKDAVEKSLTPASPTPPSVEISDQTKGDALSKAETARAEAFWSGVAPEQYDLRSTFVGKGLDIGTMQGLDAALRTAFGAMGLPQAMAAGVADAMLEASGRWDAPRSDSERRLQNSMTRYDVERLTGKSWTDVIDSVSALVNRVPRNADTESLIGRGLLTSPAVVVQLFRHAERQTQLRNSM